MNLLGDNNMWLLELVAFIVELIIMAIIFYIAGVTVVGKRRALLSDAFVISLLGTIVSNICIRFLSAYLTLAFDSVLRLNIGVILSLIGWLLLIRYYYETGWLGALAVGIMVVIIFMVVLFILDLLQVLSFLLFEWTTVLPIC